MTRFSSDSRAPLLESTFAEGNIARIAFRETPEIVLILLPRGRSGSFRLPVPPAEYGAVRRVLEDKIRARVVNIEAGILGL